MSIRCSCQNRYLPDRIVVKGYPRRCRSTSACQATGLPRRRSDEIATGEFEISNLKFQMAKTPARSRPFVHCKGLCDCAWSGLSIEAALRASTPSSGLSDRVGHGRADAEMTGSPDLGGEETVGGFEIRDLKVWLLLPPPPTHRPLMYSTVARATSDQRRCLG